MDKTKSTYKQPAGVKRGKYKLKIGDVERLSEKGTRAEAFILLLAGFETYKDMRVFFYDLFPDKSKSAGTLCQRIKELQNMNVEGKPLVTEQGYQDKWSKKRFVVNYAATFKLLVDFLISEIQKIHTQLSSDYSLLEQRRQTFQSKRAKLGLKAISEKGKTHTLELAAMYNGLIVRDFLKQKKFAQDCLNQIQSWAADTSNITKQVLFYNLREYARKLTPTGLNFDNLKDFWRGFALGVAKKGFDYYGTPSDNIIIKLEELRKLLSDYANLCYFQPETLVFELPHFTKWRAGMEPQMDEADEALQGIQDIEAQNTAEEDWAQQKALELTERLKKGPIAPKRR